MAIEPYFFNLVVTQTAAVSSPLAQSVSAYYGVDIGSMNLVLGYFTHLLATEEEGKLVSKDLGRQYKVSRDILLGASFLFLVSAIPNLDHPVLRLPSEGHPVAREPPLGAHHPVRGGLDGPLKGRGKAIRWDLAAAGGSADELFTRGRVEHRV